MEREMQVFVLDYRIWRSFRSIALFAMLLGIVLEFFACAKLQHTKKLSHHKIRVSVLSTLGEDRPCVECNCEMSSHIPSWNQTSLGNGLIGRLVRNRARSACDISVSTLFFSLNCLAANRNAAI
eukprot:IDg13465t1